MDLTGVPMLGTPKQNGFIIKLAGALGFTSLQHAVNQALGRIDGGPIPDPFPMGDASKIITALLDKCQAAGVSTFAGGGRKKSGGKRKEKSEKKEQQQGAPPLAGFTTDQLTRELGERGHGILQSLATEQLCGELERRGLPAGFLLTAPDAVAQSEKALGLMLQWYRSLPESDGWKPGVAKILFEAGRL